jgi:CheY-like chemotaxis protein
MDPQNPPDPTESPVVHDLRAYSVLVVDDDVALLEAFKEMLVISDFTVSTASNGVEALKIVMKQEIDAIICDLMMPTMAGDMFYLAVERTKPQLCNRFVFVTGYENDPKFGPFLKKSNAMVLNKPVTMDKLLNTVYLILNRPSGVGK